MTRGEKIVEELQDRFPSNSFSLMPENGRYYIVINNIRTHAVITIAWADRIFNSVDSLSLIWYYDSIILKYIKVI